MIRGKFKPGVSFGDFVVTDVMSRRKLPDDSTPRDFRRGWIIWVWVVVLFGILGVKLATLQLFYGGRYRILADENRIKQIKIPALRGQITDRNGNVLARSDISEKYDEILKLTLEKSTRGYPAGEAAAAAVGYLGQIKEDEVGLLKELDKYLPGDWIGRDGVEAVYEEDLRGEDGGRLVEVDNGGKVVREMGRKEPKVGKDLKLSLDLSLQRTALEAMEGKKGAVVASDPRTGEILTLISSPSFDPNSFVNAQYQVSNAQYLIDPNLPLFNRAIGAVYPPGSTFKMVTMAAAISEGKVNPGFTYTDTGIISVAGFKYSNWLFTKGGGREGTIGFARALTRSTDTFFYKIGEMTTLELLAKWAKNLGLGEKTGIDLPGEVAGLIPDPEWKEKAKGEKWFLGNTFHMAIGQGDVLTTPIQINQMTNILATGGKKCTPHLKYDQLNKCGNVQISEEALKLIKLGMEGACAPGGTAFPLFGFDVKTACKTGTAEYVAENGKMRTHGWLTAYAPLQDPVISITVVVEGGGEGSNVAAPVVRKMLARYFDVTDTYNYAAIPQEIGE